MLKDTQTVMTKPTHEELDKALHALFLEAVHYRDTGKGVQFLEKKIVMARKVLERNLRLRLTRTPRTATTRRRT